MIALGRSCRRNNVGRAWETVPCKNLRRENRLLNRGISAEPTLGFQAQHRIEIQPRRHPTMHRHRNKFAVHTNL